MADLAEALEPAELKAPKPKGRLAKYAPYLTVGFMALLLLVQLLGLMLRDPLLYRNASSTPESVFTFLAAAMPAHTPGHGEAAKIFGVTEVAVGALPEGASAHQSEAHHPSAPHEPPPSPSAHEAPHAPAAHVAPPPPAPHGKVDAHAAAPVKEAAKPQAAPAPKAAPLEQKAPATREAKAKTVTPQVLKEKFKADQNGDYAVTVGAFGSQRTVAQMEAKLDSLGYPHFRGITMKEMDGYTVTALSDNGALLEKLAKSLTASGYRPQRSSDRVVTRIFAEDEAARAKEAAQKAGATVSVKKELGSTPLWRVLVGPSWLENAQKAQERLKAEGLDSAIIRHRR